jgi:hypothetical protein
MSQLDGVIVGLLLVLGGPAPAGAGASTLDRDEPQCTPQFAPLETGGSNARSQLPFWAKEQAGEWGGDGWLGWTYQGNTLLPVVLSVTDWPNEDVTSVSDDPERSWAASSHDDDDVTVYSVPEVPFAARCIDGLRAGNIWSAGIGNHELHFDGPLRIALGARRYTVRLHASRAELGDATVSVTDGRRTQVLYSTDGFADDPHFYVVWAGDLDADGELDLVVNLSRKYSLHPYRLLLSSLAADPDLVGEAASFETGC